MSNAALKLIEAHAWLVSDQYAHGEWGKCEAINPSDDPRNLELSRIKPNIFTSSQAVLALLSTGFLDDAVFKRFFDWLRVIRSQDGYWTSASGSRIPSGKARGWSEVKNIRHTAKALDLLLLRRDFVPADAILLQDLLSTQLDNGAFPQHQGAQGDIWSTAYLMNLIIRTFHNSNIAKTLPRSISQDQWVVELRNHLDKARSWLCSQLSTGGLWHLEERDPHWITEALLSEIGGDLSIQRPDLCIQIANRILPGMHPKRVLGVWGLFLILPSLRPDQQRKVLRLISEIGMEDMPNQTFDVSCYCKLLRLLDAPDLLSYYVSESLGHESALTSFTRWDQSNYDRWCVRRASTGIIGGMQAFLSNPKNKTEAWLTVAHLLSTFKNQTEENRGWELLWVDAFSHRDERAIQISFWNVAKPICEGKGVIVREPETGAGPVDFEFLNGFHARVLIEFKLASADLHHGIKIQLPAYMHAYGVDSAFFVVVGFSEKDFAKFNKMKEDVNSLQARNQDQFVQCLYIDADRRMSASKR